MASKYHNLFNHMQLKAFQPLTTLCPVSLGTEVTGYGFHHLYHQTRHQAEASSGSEWLTVHPSSQFARLSEAEIKRDPNGLLLVESVLEIKAQNNKKSRYCSFINLL